MRNATLATGRPVTVPTDPAPHLVAPAGRVDAYLAEFVASRPAPANLKDAVMYALLAGGKRLRPVLAWHCAAAVGGAGQASLPAGAAVELIHAFSLVHDDLPALDDDDLRRGRPTLHKASGEAMAILAGDAMMNMAYELLLSRVTPTALAGVLASELATGTGAMIDGQVFDTLGGFDKTTGDVERLRVIHRNKTGALIRAACRMGALSVLGVEGLRSSALAQVTVYAEAVGLMFQIVDDILDVTQTAEHVGKKTGKDLELGKLTFPGVIGLEASRAEVARTLDAALQATAALGAGAAPLAELARYMAVRTR